MFQRKNNLGNHDPRIGRKGYVSTAFYPFYHASKSWGDLSFSVASYPYKITLTIANSSVEADDEAFFDFFKNGQLVERYVSFLSKLLTPIWSIQWNIAVRGSNISVEIHQLQCFPST
jgi:hypothetical protein